MARTRLGFIEPPARRSAFSMQRKEIPMRNVFRNRAVGAALVVFALAVTACGSGDDSTDTTGDGGGVPSIPDGPTIVVGSTNFGEQLILGDIYATVLEENGYPVDRRFNLGSREVVNPALKSGEIDLLAEYTGTLLTFEGGTSSTDSQDTWDDLVEILDPSGLTALDFSPAQDKNGFVVTAETADELDVSTVSDLAAYNGELVLGGPPECPEREFCLVGLQEVYGLSFAGFSPLDAGGSLTKAALTGGEVDVALLFTSDGFIAAEGLVLLEDDQNLQPAENIVPIIRTEILDTYGDDLAAVLNEVSAAITTAELSELNRRFGEGEDADALALDWLVTNGFLSGE
jgi:osmoprotectant transport system substrate-binding protein